MNLAEQAAAPHEGPAGGISRRSLLAGLAGGAALATLPRWPAYAQASARIAIVGGGLAGLGALDTLRRNNVAATLYEARGAAGGRTRSVRNVFAPVFAFDEGAQLVNTDHADLLALIRRYGIGLVDRQAYGPAREVQIGRNGTVATEARLAAQLRGIAAQISADADRIGSDVSYSAEIDRLSVQDYVDRHGLRRGDARDALETAIRTEYGSEPQEASALELLFNLPRVEGRHLHRITGSDERYLVAGGTDQVAKALAAEHERDIRLNKRLAAVAFGGAGVRLGFTDGEQVEADRVVLALPVTLLREIRIEGPLPPLWRAFIDEVRLGRNEKVIVGYDGSPWRRTIGFGGALWANHGFSAAWEAVSLAPAPGPAALCYFLGGNQVDAASGVDASELARRFTAVARRALPGLTAPNGIVRRTRWTDDPLTKGSYSRFAPGQLTRFASLFAREDENGGFRAAEAGPLLFAGEHISDEYAGFMNGALQSGRIAAQAILAPAAARRAAA
jgi:monoamine oxidase